LKKGPLPAQISTIIRAAENAHEVPVNDDAALEHRSKKLLLGVMLLSFFMQKKILCHCVPLQILLLLCFIVMNNENKARILFRP